MDTSSLEDNLGGVLMDFDTSTLVDEMADYDPEDYDDGWGHVLDSGQVVPQFDTREEEAGR